MSDYPWQIIDPSAASASEARMPIAVWRFDDAPAFLQDLSTNGGDEDWLAVVPDYLSGESEYIPWMEVGGFGCCCVDHYPHPTTPGFVVAIGSHS